MSNIFYKKRRKIPAGPADWSVAGSNLRGGPPPLSGAGIPAFSKRKPGRKESQGVPPCTPENKTARWGSLHLLRLCLLQPSLSGKSAPDQIWKRLFGEKIFCWILLCEKIQPQKISQKKVSQSGNVHGLQSNPLPSRCAAIPKDGASEQRAALKPGVQGQSPWCSFLHFSHEKWRPPAGIPPGALRPEAASEARPRRVRTTGGGPPAPRRRV